MLKPLSRDQKIDRIKSAYGDRTPRTQWFLLGIDEKPYLRQTETVEHLFFGSNGAGMDGMRLSMADIPELMGQIFLRITDSAVVITELEIENKVYPLIRVGDDTDDEDDGPQPMILLADEISLGVTQTMTLSS